MVLNNFLMEGSVKERIKEFLAHLGLGQNKFEERVGFSNGYINNVKSIGSDKLNKIITEYPLLNLEWLITGKGEMFKTHTISDNVGSSIVMGNNNDVYNKNNEIGTSYQDLLEIIRKKDEQIASKDEQIASKDQQINSLLELLKK